MAKTELRLVETVDDIRCSIGEPSGRDKVALMWAFGLLPVVFAAVSTAIPVVIAAAFLAYFTAVIGIVSAASWNRFQHVRIGVTGVRIREQRVRQATHQPLDHARVLGGEDSAWLVGGRKPDERVFLYTSIEAMGMTDFGIWFEMDGVREEVVLETLSIADVRRLYDEIEPRWTRAREAMTDTSEDVERRRRALEGLRG